MESSKLVYGKVLTADDCKRIRFHAYSSDGVRIATFKSWIELCQFVYINKGTTWDSELIEVEENLDASKTRSR